MHVPHIFTSILFSTCDDLAKIPNFLLKVHTRDIKNPSTISVIRGILIAKRHSKIIIRFAKNDDKWCCGCIGKKGTNVENKMDVKICGTCTWKQ